MRKWRPAGLALVLAAVTTGAHCQQVRTLSEHASAASAAAKSVVAFDPARYLHSTQSTDMAFDWHGSYPMSPSAWQENEKKIYAALFAGHKYQTLVVPFEVTHYGFDRATRSLMTVELSRAIGRAQGKPMPDPFLVERALGDGARTVRRDQAKDLARLIGAKRIIWCYVGHLEDGKMKIFLLDTTAQVIRGRAYFRLSALRSYQEVSFSDGNPPLEAYRAVLPKLLKDLGYVAAASPKRVKSSFRANTLPATPLGLASGKENPARDAYFLQLLGALTPRREERERERLYEKSLLATERMAPASPQYHALKARAYLHLGLRPAALKVLGKPATVEEKALQAALNGNLPGLRALIRHEKQLVPRMLEMLEANRIAADYGVLTKKDSAAAAASLELPGKIWPVLAARAFIDWDGWSQQDNLVLKQILDEQLPIQGYTANGIVGGAMAIGDLDRARTSAELSVLEHVHRLLAANPAKWCCADPVDRPTVEDYLDVVNAIATDNLMRRAHLYTMIQGRPAHALEFLGEIQGVFAGYPEFALERGYAEWQQAQQAEGEARNGEERAALLDALNAMYWSHGQTRVAADAWGLMGELKRMDFGTIGNWYGADLPFRSFYPNWARGLDPAPFVRNSLAALKNSASDFSPVNDLEALLEEGSHRDPAQMQAVLRQIDGRFAGCPGRDLLFANLSINKGDVAAAEVDLRKGIADAPRDWRAYSMLGKLYFGLAQPEKSARVFMSYPGFRKNAPENPVDVSNHAYEAASGFYWSGEFALAKPLYRIAADLDTGSAASISSAVRLAMLDGDYRRVIGGLLVRAQRYGSAYAFRDYLGMLHAMGYSKEAWSAFDALLPRLHASQLWETALVGQRMQRMSEAEIVAWASRSDFRNVGVVRGDAAVYLVRAGITDRMPSSSLAKSVGRLAWPVWHLPHWHDMVVRAGPTAMQREVLGPDVTQAGSVLPLGVLERQAKVPVTSDLESFVRGYRDLRLGRAAAAAAIFRDVSVSYDLRLPELGYLLPYYAFAAARAGDTSGVESILKRIEPEYRAFDYFLAEAAIAGLRSRTKTALASLRKALYRRPYTEERPVYTEYQYAEMVEWLYQATHEDAYRKLALDWVKKVEVFTPWYAWPYAMQAELDHDKAGRRRAIAMAAYLDPGSERLAKLPKAEVARAVRAFTGLNPFLQLSASARKKSGI